MLSVLRDCILFIFLSGILKAHLYYLPNCPISLMLPMLVNIPKFRHKPGAVNSFLSYAKHKIMIRAIVTSD